MNLSLSLSEFVCVYLFVPLSLLVAVLVGLKDETSVLLYFFFFFLFFLISDLCPLGLCYDCESRGGTLRKLPEYPWGLGPRRNRFVN